MAYQRTLLILVICLLSLLAIMPLSAQSQTEEINVLPPIVVGISGNETASRYFAETIQGGNSLPLTVGSALAPGDIINVPDGSTLVIMCADSPQSLTGRGLSGCDAVIPQNSNIYYWGPVIIRGNFRGLALAVTAPGSSRIAAPPGEISWWYEKDMGGGNVTYELTVVNAETDFEILKIELIRDTTLAFPHEILSLINAGVRVFDIRITAIGPESNDRAETVSTFCLVDQTFVMTNINVDTLSPELFPNWVSPESLNYMLAHRYYQSGMYSDALAILSAMLPVELEHDLDFVQASANNIIWSPAFYVLVGDVYAALAVNELAKLAYLKAAGLAEELGDKITLAVVNVRLGDIEKMFSVPENSPQTARDYYAAAIEIYNDIGYETEAENVRQYANEQISPAKFLTACNLN